MRKTVSRLLTILVLCLLAAGCSTPEDKKKAFYEKAEDLFARGRYTEARLEVKNALQIDPQYAEAYFLLAMTGLKTGDLRGAYQNLSRTVDLKPGHLKAQLQLGRILLAAGEKEKALDKAYLSLRLDPHNTDAKILSASVFLADGKVDQARSLLNEVLAGGMKNQDACLLLASSFMQEGDRRRARETLVEGSRHNPASVPVHLFLARLYTGDNDIPAAVAILNKVIALEPGKASHKFDLADLYWKSGQKEAARHIIDGLSKADPGNEDNRIAAMRFFVDRGLTGDGERQLKEGIASNTESFRLRFALSELYTNTSRTDKALDILNESLALKKKARDPDIIQTRILLADAWLMKGDPGRAEKIIRKVLDLSPKSAQGHFIMGKIHSLKGERTDAVNEFRTVIFLKPEDEDAHISLARAHAENGEPSLAVAVLSEAVKTHAGSGRLMHALATAYMLKDDYAQSEKVLRNLLNLHPEDIDAKASLGDLLAKQGKHAEARGQYEEIIKAAPAADLGYERLANHLVQQGKSRAALSVLEKGLAETGGSQDIFISISKLYGETGRADKAEKLCKDMMARDPGNAVPHYVLGLTLTSNKKHAKAEESFKKAIELDPRWEAPHKSLALLFLLEGRKEESVGKFQDMIRTDPKNPSTYISLGQIYEMLGEYEKSIDTYSRGITAVPDSWYIMNNLAALLCNHGRSGEGLKKALDLARKAAVMAPDEPAVLDTLGWIYYRTNQFDAARSTLEKALGKNPGNPEINLHLGLTLHRAGRSEEAKKRLEAALRSGNRISGKAEAEKALKEIRNNA